MMKLLSAKSLNTENTKFECVIEHPDFGEIPFTAIKGDIESEKVLVLIGDNYDPWTEQDQKEQEARDLIDKRQQMQVSKAQMDIWLKQNGHWDKVMDVLNNGKNPNAKAAFELTKTFQRLGTNIIQMGTLLGLDDEQIDNAFEEMSLIDLSELTIEI